MRLVSLSSFLDLEVSRNNSLMNDLNLDQLKIQAHHPQIFSHGWKIANWAKTTTGTFYY